MGQGGHFNVGTMKTEEDRTWFTSVGSKVYISEELEEKCGQIKWVQIIRGLECQSL